MNSEVLARLPGSFQTLAKFASNLKIAEKEAAAPAARLDVAGVLPNVISERRNI